MKKNILLLVTGLTLSITMHAQLALKPANGSTAPESAETAGAKIVQLVNAMRPASFTPAFKKDKPAFVTAAAGSNDAGTMAKYVSRLVGYIKPDKFKNGVSGETLTKNSAGITTLAQAKMLLVNVESGLQPKAMNDIWQLQRGQWIKDLKPGIAVGK
jgi:hypothetical protein